MKWEVTLENSQLPSGGTPSGEAGDSLKYLFAEGFKHGTDYHGGLSVTVETAEIQRACARSLTVEQFEAVLGALKAGRWIRTWHRLGAQTLCREKGPQSCSGEDVPTAAPSSSSFPPLLRAQIAQFGITEENYDMWVAGHEAAHAVVGIGHEGTLQHIGTSPMTLGTSLSRARCEWGSLAGRLTWKQILDLIAAGPAYDDLHASNYGIPMEAHRQIKQDRQTAEEAVFSHLNFSSAKKEESWQQAIETAKTALRDAANMRMVEALQKVIFLAIRNRTPLLTADEVRIAMSATPGKS